MKKSDIKRVNKIEQVNEMMNDTKKEIKNNKDQQLRKQKTNEKLNKKKH